MMRLRPLWLAALAAPLSLLAAPAAADRYEPLPRFEDALCPGVAGLPVEAAEMVVGRIRQNAEMLGRRMAEPGTCEANVIVALVPDSQRVMQRMNADRGYVFVEMSPAERKAMLADEGPVHVLSRVFTRTRDGIPVYRRDSLTEPAQANMWMAHSKIYTGTQQNIVYALVLIDGAAAKGLTLDQLADYATMRALVHEAPKTADVDSILNLFGTGAKPAGLTEYDKAFLRGLYEGLPNLPGNARAATIAKATGREVEPE